MTTGRQSVARARELMHSLRQVHRAMTALMRLEADKLGLTPVQMLVLRTLADDPGLSLSELAERIALGCSTVSGVVKRLVEAGLVERTRLDEDQRTVAIRLTSQGNELENAAFCEDSLMSKALLKFLQLPEENVQTLLELHTELIRILNAD